MCTVTFDKNRQFVNYAMSIVSNIINASVGEPIARVPELALIALSVGTRTVAPVQSSLPEK